MKNIFFVIILFVGIIISGCTNKKNIEKSYSPKVGDSTEYVYSKIGSPFFSYDFLENGEIFGYMYLEEGKRFSGYGPGMIDENQKDAKVFMIFFQNNIIDDILIVDHFSSKLIGGYGRELFKEKWKTQKIDSGGQGRKTDSSK